MKRLIGRPASSVSDNHWRFPFPITDTENQDKASIQIDDERYLPEEICGMMLKEIKDAATSHLQEEVTGAVITVPGCFSHSQRTATIAAAEQAGFTDIRLLDDALSTAIVYNEKTKIKPGKSQVILVFSSGSGTTEACVIKIENSKSGKTIYHVIARSGSSIIGGIEFDKELVQELKTIIQKNYKGSKLDDPRPTARLRKVAERAKQILSTGPVAAIDIEQIVDGKDGREKISQERLAFYNFIDWILSFGIYMVKL